MIKIYTEKYSSSTLFQFLRFSITAIISMKGLWTESFMPISSKIPALIPVCKSMIYQHCTPHKLRVKTSKIGWIAETIEDKSPPGSGLVMTIVNSLDHCPS